MTQNELEDGYEGGGLLTAEQDVELRELQAWLTPERIEPLW